MLKVIIVEDEFPGQEFLKNCLLKNYENISISHIASSVNEAVEAINKYKPDLVFLDIEIINGTGFDVLDKISERNFEIIFTTAYNQFALQAIKKHAFDYILKPININELTDSVDRVCKKIIESKLVVNNTFRDKIIIPTLKGIEYLDSNQILYLEANGSYTFLVTETSKILSSKNLGEFENLINKELFHRCHNSFIVNITKIKKFHKNRSGTLILTNGDVVPVSQRKMKDFSNLIN
jgi:two-component system LytT family response regulator